MIEFQNNMAHPTTVSWSIQLKINHWNNQMCLLLLATQKSVINVNKTDWQRVEDSIIIAYNSKTMLLFIITKSLTPMKCISILWMCKTFLSSTHVNGISNHCYARNERVKTDDFDLRFCLQFAFCSSQWMKTPLMRTKE